jgi:8-oxo-dGTP diphosphatase
MSNTEKVPRLGIALIMTCQQRLLIGRRKNQPMQHSWQLPGGWLRYLEAPEQAVLRILDGFNYVECEPARLVNYTSNVFAKGEHSISLYFQVDCPNGTDIDLHSNQDCSDWMWADWYDLPEPLFLPLKNLKRSDYDPFIRHL